MNGDERPERVTGILVPHLLAVGVMLWQGWFVLQPISGDMAFWSPASATFLAAAIWLVAGGTFALMRWGRYRALLLADLAALPAIAIGSLSFFLLFFGAVTALLILAGMAMTWRARDRVGHLGRSSPRPIGRAALAVLMLAVVDFWWYGLTIAYDFIGAITGYGLAEVMIGGVVGAAILLWLDRRPGLLLGSSVSLVYFGAFGLANGVDLGIFEAIVESAILLVSGLLGVILAGRDLLPRRGIGLLIPIAVGAGCAAAVLLEPLLVPFVVAAAVVFERTLDTDVPQVMALPATP